MSSVALGFDSASFHLRNEGAEDKEGTGSDSCVGSDFGALASPGAAKSTINSMETAH